MAYLPLWEPFSDPGSHFCSLKPLCPSASVVRVHDGALSGVICDNVNNAGGSRRWLITVEIVA